MTDEVPTGKLAKAAAECTLDHGLPPLSREG